MSQTTTIPNPPTTKAEAITCLAVLGLSLKETMGAIEANPEWVNGSVRTLLRAHGDLNRGGYLLEELFGVSEGTFGAGGNNKPW